MCHVRSLYLTRIFGFRANVHLLRTLQSERNVLKLPDLHSQSWKEKGSCSTQVTCRVVSERCLRNCYAEAIAVNFANF